MTIAAAVLDQDERGAIVWDPRRSTPWYVGRRPIAGVVDLVALADALDTWQLWLHPRWTAAHPSVEVPHWSAHVGARRRVQIASPAGDRSFGPLGDARDGRELLCALVGLQESLQTPWRGTPGRTGTDLLERLLRRTGARSDVILPPVQARELDYAWLRPLDDDERRRRWVHGFDKHAMYLVAASTVRVGVGDAELRIHPTFVSNVPGYWHVRDRWPADRQLADPSRSHPERSPRTDRDGYRWLTTPSVAALAYAGALDDVAAAWLWPEHRRALEPFAKVLRSARASLEDGGELLAIRALKSVYAETLGGWLAHERDEASPAFRPDWHDLLKAEARTRLWHNVRQLVDAGGPVPFGIATDALYLVSDAEDPRDVVGDALPLGSTPRTFAWLGRAPLEDLVDLVDPRYRVARLSRAFKEAASRG